MILQARLLTTEPSTGSPSTGSPRWSWNCPTRANQFKWPGVVKHRRSMVVTCVDCGTGRWRDCVDEFFCLLKVFFLLSTMVNHHWATIWIIFLTFCKHRTCISNVFCWDFVHTWNCVVCVTIVLPPRTTTTPSVCPVAGGRKEVQIADSHRRALWRLLRSAVPWQPIGENGSLQKRHANERHGGRKFILGCPRKLVKG